MILEGKRILVQYSGGKDSTACMIKLLEEEAYVEAVHFVHKYGYDLPTIEAKRMCCEHEVKIHIIDITKQIDELFLSGFDQRPCRFCKGIMDNITVELAVQNNFEYICVGDTASDTALVERLKAYDKENLVINRYFNKAVELPENISVIRPLIAYDNDAVFEFLHKHSVEIKRNNDTGDKYFEYSREGCPLQFKDYGVRFSKELMEKLKTANTLCSEFATKQGIKASIHMPSEMIVTIPKGHEEQCRQYLIDKGIELTKKYRIQSICKRYFFSVEIYAELFEEDKIVNLFSRFMERITESVKSVHMENHALAIKSDNAEIHARLLENELKMVGDICSLRCLNQERLDSLFVELFHTYNFRIVYVDDCVQIKDTNIIQSVPNCRCISGNSSSEKIIRSSTIDNINHEDITYLAANRIYTVIDLRNEKKCEKDLVQRLAAKGIEYRHVPFIGNNSFSKEKQPDLSKKTIGSYMSLLVEYENLKEIFEAISENDGGVMIFCKYGRDRTGIISMILNLLVNRSREHIVLDYVASDLFLNSSQYEDRIYEYSSNVPLGFMIDFLEKYQSAYHYLRLIGVSERNIKRIIDKMGE